MDDVFGRLWDRYPERRSRPYYYSQNPNQNPFSSLYAPDYYFQPQPVTQSVPSLRPRTFSVPVSDHHNPPRNRPKEHYSSSSKPKNVVSVPIKILNSDAPKAPSNDKKKAVAASPSMDENTAAVKIQKVFRGFTVRKSAPLKNLKIIAKARAEGEEIRKHISDEKVVDLVRRNEKERLKITEWIMSLLLKLDAIQGVNSVVRESRKTAARELINLQETVDAIIAGKPMEEQMLNGDTVCPHTEDNPDILDKTEETTDLECLNGNSGEEIKEEDQLEHPKDAECVDDTEVRNLKPSEMQAEKNLPTQMNDLQLECSYETEDFSTSQGADKSVELEKVRSNVSGFDNGLIADMLEIETVEDNENMKTEYKHMKDEEVVDATGTGDTSPTREEATAQGDENIKEEYNNMEDEVVDATGTGETFSTGEEATAQGDENIKEEYNNMEDEEVVNATGTVDTLPTREEATEDIGMVREENKILKTTVADLLKKSEKQSQMIDNLSSRIAQLEEQVSKKKKIGDQRKKTAAMADFASRMCAGDESENGTTALADDRMLQPQERRRRRKLNKHLNGLREDWF